MTALLRFAPHVAGFALLALLAGYTYRAGHEAGAEKVQAAWDRGAATRAQATTETLMQAKKMQDALYAQIEATQTKARHEVRRIRTEHAALVDSLRDRPEARAGDPGAPEAASHGVGCTGAQLSRRDGEFLAGFAADAARTQAALQQCVDAYNQVREAANGRDQD